MKILYSDDPYPVQSPKYKGKTIGQVLEATPVHARRRLIAAINRLSPNMALSDEVAVYVRRTHFFNNH